MIDQAQVEADLYGRLRTFTLSDIFQLLSFGGQTGTLTLTQGWNSRAIVFEHGRITYITAATRLPGIGELLVRSGKLTEAQLARALASPDVKRDGLANVLLVRGWATPADLQACADQQLEETLYSLFLWRNCTFSFQSGVVEKSDGLPVDITAERIIMDGTRRVDEWVAISPVVPSVYMTFRLQGTPQAMSSVALEPVDDRVLQAIDGRRDVVAIAKACSLTQFDAARSLFRLVQAGLAIAQPPDKLKIIELFDFLVESIYRKLIMYGYPRVASQFEQDLERFAMDNGLKVRMRTGKITLSDHDSPISSTALIDVYRLFIAIQQNRFSRLFDAQIVHGLTQGLYLHVDQELRELLQMYEFHPIEGLLGRDVVHQN